MIFFFRIVSRFYLEGRIQKGVELDNIKKHNHLSYLATVPSFVFFVASFFPLVWYPTVRTLYWQSLVMGSILGYSWLAFKSVC